MALSRPVAALLCAATLTGCITRPMTGVGEADAARRLPWLVRGATTREDMVMRLGLPSGRFESDRILTWRLRLDQEILVAAQSRRGVQGLGASGWLATPFNLVAVFDGSGVASRTSVIAVR